MHIEPRVKWLALAAIVAFPVVAWMSQPSGAPAPAPESDAAPRSTATFSAVDMGDIEQRVAALEEASAQADRVLTAAVQAQQPPDIPAPEILWALSRDETGLPPLPLNPAISDAEVVRLPESLAALEKTPGDRLVLPLPQGGSLAVTVEDATRLPDGDYVWRGHVDGEGDDFPVVFTIGRETAFATITSLQGSYTMESVNGVGWLYRNIAWHGVDALPVGDDEALLVN